MIQSGCVLKVGVIGLNHKIADLAFRESIAWAAASLSGEKGYFFAHPTVLLSTCNRIEIYFGGDHLAAIHSDLLRWLRLQMAEPFEHRLYSYFGIDCLVHLGHVAAGLDSAIIAETEIQRQVKVAYANSAKRFALSSCLHYLFQKALKLGKLVRSQVQMEQRAPTLLQAIWQLAIEKLGNFTEKKILLVGHSETNRRLAFFLFQRGVKQFSLATQDPMRVQLQGCRACDRSEVEHWQDYELIICAAHSKQYMIQGTSLSRHVIFDLSVPRNVDPDVGKQPNIYLYNIEQINAWIDCKRVAYGDQLSVSKALIWQHATRLAAVYKRKLKIGMAGVAREGDDVADIFHSGCK